MDFSGKRRNRKLPYPEGYAPLSEIFDAIGRERFGEAWDGREVAAEILERTPEQILEQLREVQVKLADPDKPPSLSDDELADYAQMRARGMSEDQALEAVGEFRALSKMFMGEERARARGLETQADLGRQIYALQRQLDPDNDFGLWEPEDDFLPLGELSPKQIEMREHIKDRVEWAEKNPDEALEQAAASYGERYKRGQRRVKAENFLRKELHKELHAKRPNALLFERATGNRLQVKPSWWLAEEFEVSFVTSRASWKEETPAGIVERSGEIVVAVEPAGAMVQATMKAEPAQKDADNVPRSERYIEWERRQRELRYPEGAKISVMTLRAAAQIIATAEDVDLLHVERETRRVRQEREKREKREL